MSMIDTFLRGVGFDPAEFAQATAYYKKEFEAMKAGVVQGLAHFAKETKEIRDGEAVINENVLRMERKLDAMETLLSRVDAKLTDLLSTRSNQESVKNGNGSTNGLSEHEHIRALSSDFGHG